MKQLVFDFEQKMPTQENGFIELVSDDIPSEILNLANKLLYAWWLSEGDKQLRDLVLKDIQCALSGVRVVIHIAEEEIVEALRSKGTS